MTISRLKILSFLSCLLFGGALAMPLLVFAQQLSTLGQHVDPGNFSIDTTPESIDFPGVTITAPTLIKSYYNGFTNNNPLTVHDGRYSGGIKVTVQASDYVKTGSPAVSIPASRLAIVTTNPSFNEVRKTGTPAMSDPLNGDPTNDSTYTPFVDSNSPLVILDGTACETQGRVGVYTLYPSFRLIVQQPPEKPSAGTYTNTITYTIMNETVNSGAPC